MHLHGVSRPFLFSKMTTYRVVCSSMKSYLWFGLMGSNHHSQGQSLVSCRLDEARSNTGSGRRIRTYVMEVKAPGPATERSPIKLSSGPGESNPSKQVWKTCAFPDELGPQIDRLAECHKG